MMFTRTFCFATLATITAYGLVAGCGLPGPDQLEEQLNQLADNLAALQEDVQAGLDEPGTPGAQGERGDQGEPGVAGEDGLDCWDLNGNGAADLDSEDINEDGKVDVEDCRGADGEDGQNGRNGRNGTNGSDGDDGDPGRACWDLNGNGIGDLATEDINKDGKVDVKDCQGLKGDPGDPGDPGYVAKAKISAAGTVVTNGSTGVIEAELLEAGRYRVKVEIRAGIDLNDVELRDFPLTITAHPALLYPGQIPERLLAVAEHWELDAVARTLELRVFIQSLDTPEGYRSAAFTLLVHEP